jgi:hypothetical protein
MFIRVALVSAFLSLITAACGQDGGPAPPSREPLPGGEPGPPRPPVTTNPTDAMASVPVDADGGAAPDSTSPATADGGVSPDSTPSSDTGPAAGPCTPETSLACNPLRPLPMMLRETGLYPVPGNLDTLPPGVFAFVPSFQLWSDGLYKKRAVILPAGKKIDISNREAWDFPIGTVFIKTFLADGPNGMKPIETRIIRRTDNPDIFEQYTYDVYRWDSAGTDAILLNIDERTPAPATLGARNFNHQIPSRNDCRRCHGTNDTIIIGFDEIRLNFAPTPGGKPQLETFAQAGFFNDAPPSPAAQITDPDPLTQRVKSYLYGNCYHCHNGNDSTIFPMPPDDLYMTVVRQPTMGSGTAAGIRVVPGNPEMSVLYRQMVRTNLMRGYNPMPPVGVQLADRDALQMVRQWIISLR